MSSADDLRHWIDGHMKPDHMTWEQYAGWLEGQLRESCARLRREIDDMRAAMRREGYLDNHRKSLTVKGSRRAPNKSSTIS